MNEFPTQMVELREDMKLKLDVAALNYELDEVRRQYQRFALYEDYRGLYDKVVPPIASFEKVIEKFTTKMEQWK